MTSLYNLSNCKVDETHVAGYPITLRDSDGELLLVYTKPAMAIGEVVYSRLSDMIGIPCIQSEFAVGLDIVSPDLFEKFKKPQFVSISRCGDFTRLYRSKMKITDRANYKAHIILELTLGDHEIRGFVNADKQFLKARNGESKWVDELKCRLQEKMYFYPLNTRTDILEKVYSEDSFGILNKIANLSIEQMIQCAEIPDLEHKNEATDFILERLVETKKAAEKVLCIAH